ncbi:hypothetical protein QW71_31185, partial [Paenibacillus sp. IHB B 3415]
GEAAAGPVPAPDLAQGSAGAATAPPTLRPAATVPPALSPAAAGHQPVSATVQAQLLRSWTAAMPLRSLAELAVTGHELAGVLQKRPGPWLGVLLNKLLLAAAAGGIANDKQLLLQEAQRMDSDEE